MAHLSFMKNFAAWFRPVAVSLLLHAVLIVLVAHRLSITSRTDNKQVQTLTVELQGKTPSTESKPSLQKSKPIVTAKPIQEPVKTKQPTVLDSPTEQSQPATALPEPASPATHPVVEPGQSSLNIQPLSKLTRPPAFLHRIEPVYPGAEQRAGSQAYVLAEATIDEHGSVLDVKIMKSAGSAFDNAVIEALKKSIFVPGYIGKDAVAVRVLVPFRFNLK